MFPAREQNLARNDQECRLELFQHLKELQGALATAAVKSLLATSLVKMLHVLETQLEA